MPAYPKENAFRSEKWLRAVASLDCVLCGAHGTQAAHINEGKGMGIKTHDSWTAAMCVSCHSEIDQGGKMTREERREAMRKAVLLTLAELCKQGKIVVKAN